MECRKCGACCIALSISSELPGMPDGKPAGVACPHLDGDNLCLIFSSGRRPRVCSEFQPAHDVCGSRREEALELMAAMEEETRPR